MTSTTTDAGRLEALADLLDAGQSPAEALAALVRLGGAVAFWARPLEAVARTMPLGMALAQLGQLTDAELTWVGGAEHAGKPASLRVVAARRRARVVRGRSLWGALLMPGAVVLLSAVSTRFVLALLGGGASGWVGDVLPLAVVGLGVALGLKDRTWTLASLRGLPGVGSWLRAHDAARAAEALGAALLRSDVRTDSGQAAAFAVAARLASAPALAATAERVRAGTALAEALPSAVAVGEPLALALTAGLAADDLAARLLAFAAATDAHLTARLRTVVRVLAWGCVVWVSFRGLWSFSSLNFMGSDFMGGAGGLPPGVVPKDVDQLMQELDL